MEFASHINARQEHVDLVARAVAVVGADEFNRRVEAASDANWPRRHLESDDVFARMVQTHVALARHDVAREILDPPKPAAE